MQEIVGKGLLSFLNNFSSDLSKSIMRDGREHTEYVPTQIITEFIRHFARYNGGKFDGIIYRSAVKKEGQSMVIFADHEACLEDEENPGRQILRMTNVSLN